MKLGHELKEKMKGTPPARLFVFLAFTLVRWLLAWAFSLEVVGELQRSQGEAEQARSALQQREEAHQVLAQAVERLLGELRVGDGPSLQERVALVPGRTRE